MLRKKAFVERHFLCHIDHSCRKSSFSVPLILYLMLISFGSILILKKYFHVESAALTLKFFTQFLLFWTYKTSPIVHWFYRAMHQIKAKNICLCYMISASQAASNPYTYKRCVYAGKKIRVSQFRANYAVARLAESKSLKGICQSLIYRLGRQ